MVSPQAQHEILQLHLRKIPGYPPDKPRDIKICLYSPAQGHMVVTYLTSMDSGLVMSKFVGCDWNLLDETFWILYASLRGTSGHQQTHWWNPHGYFLLSYEIFRGESRFNSTMVLLQIWWYSFTHLTTELNGPGLHTQDCIIKWYLMVGMNHYIYKNIRKKLYH